MSLLPTETMPSLLKGGESMLGGPMNKWPLNEHDYFSPLQMDRKKWRPILPATLSCSMVAKPNEKNALVIPDDAAVLETLFPHTWNQPYVDLVPGPEGTRLNHPPLRLGVVLSGGQAPGGHNVISGLFDYGKSCNPNSQLFGFLNGPWGIFSHQYKEISAEFMDKFRNQGGFDMICSGRHKIESEEQKQASLQICKKLDLHGLVVVGGDDSNTNAAILADYFKASGSTTQVIGVPKTIDGDLKNEYVETSFGFDTAVKVFSELIGNLTTDVGTSQNRYHFVRLMGRSSSNIALECALQTRPNLTFVGEEVEASKISLKALVNEIVEMVLARYSLGKTYGIILVPEGLIEFIPEVGVLIRQINDILAQGEFDAAKLTPENRDIFEFLPLTLQHDLLLERDPHGNVQVSRIQTEKLLSVMAKTELEKRSAECGIKFIPTTHFFGYEGRCAMPTNFDANYCYALGHTAGALVDNGVTACMAVVRHLHLPADEWKPAGCPITKMMHIERRKGKNVPVIKKYVVDLKGSVFQCYKKVRDNWKTNDYYRNPGPIQFFGPTADITNYTILPPCVGDLLPRAASEEAKKRFHLARVPEQLSPLQRERLTAHLELSPLLTSPLAIAVKGSRYFAEDRLNTTFVTCALPMLCHETKFTPFNIVERASWDQNAAAQTQLRIGVALCGQQTPGAQNVVLGLIERMDIPIPGISGSKRGKIIGFKGIQGLLEGKYIELEKKDFELYTNQAGFEMLGRTEEAKPIMRTAAGIQKVVEVCKGMKLDGLVMIGGQTTVTCAAMLTEAMLTYEQQHGVVGSPHTAVVVVPANQESNLRHPLLETTLGFDSTSKAFATLVGNLLTDAASATKYWYFVRLMGQAPSHIVLESALQTHPNFTVVSEKYANEDETLNDVIQDIADVVCVRAEEGKNFGTVLVPEGLVSHLPQLKMLVGEVAAVLGKVSSPEEMRQLEKEFLNIGSAESNKFLSQLTPWSLALLKTLPEFFREQLVKRTPSGGIELSEVGTEQLLSVLVTHEMARRKAAGNYKGTFSPVCHYFGFQGRSTFPSQFDCCLGLAHGYLAAITVESKLTGYMTSIRGLCGAPSSWKMTCVPVACFLKVMPGSEMKLGGKHMPMTPCAEVDLNSKPFAAFRSDAEKWINGDHFCNPGPIQFTGCIAKSINRTLHEDQYHYLQMLGQLEGLISHISHVCSFGVGPSKLRTTVISLEALQKILQSEQDQPE